MVSSRMAAVPTGSNEGRSSERAPDATARLRVLARVSHAFAEVATDLYNAASAHRDPDLEEVHRQAPVGAHRAGASEASFFFTLEPRSATPGRGR
jgi:hypothetical protein